MIYYGLFSGLQSGSVYQSMVMMIAIITIAITGGIAIFGFSKAFGVTFLGASRTDVHINENAISAGMLFPKLLIAAVILLAGLAPLLFLSPIMGMTSTLFHLDQVPEMNALFQTLAKISLVSIILITLIILLLLIRRRVNNSSKTTYGPTWGCGYTNPSPRQQYTGTSWAANIAELAGPILREKVECQPIYEEEVFPADRSISGRFGDVFRSAVNYIADFSALILKKIARLQTGNIQHYILYAFIFILVIFILLYLNIL
jgi:hypothetical protein